MNDNITFVIIKYILNYGRVTIHIFILSQSAGLAKTMAHSPFFFFQQTE